MSRLRLHAERHAVERIGWLRAAVLGANDGIVSTASLIVGVAAAERDPRRYSDRRHRRARRRRHVDGGGRICLGQLAVGHRKGRYCPRDSASSRDDSEAELDELTGIYVDRGLTPELARQVAEQLTAKDALGAHARDELHLSEMTAARPVQAALTSAATFAAGAALPMLTVAIVPERMIAVAVTAASLVFLALLGAIGAAAGGAGVTKAVVRVTFWGALAMAITAGIGKLFGMVV